MSESSQEIGFGGGVADMTVSYLSGSSKRQLLSYSAAAADAGKPLTGKHASARNAAIATHSAAGRRPPR